MLKKEKRGKKKKKSPKKKIEIIHHFAQPQPKQKSQQQQQQQQNIFGNSSRSQPLNMKPSPNKKQTPFRTRMYKPLAENKQFSFEDQTHYDSDGTPLMTSQMVNNQGMSPLTPMESMELPSSVGNMWGSLDKTQMSFEGSVTLAGPSNYQLSSSTFSLQNDDFPLSSNFGDDNSNNNGMQFNFSDSMILE